jgi:hypothetical protein
MEKSAILLLCTASKIASGKVSPKPGKARFYKAVRKAKLLIDYFYYLL